MSGAPLSQGIFWVLCGDDAEGRPDLSSFELLAFRVRCGPDGRVLEDGAALNSKSGTSFNHRAQWSLLPRRRTGGHSYQYHPRGRVEIKRGRALVFLNPVLNTEAVLGRIRLEFGLEGGQLRGVEVKCDGSAHYRCRFDDPSIG